MEVILIAAIDENRGIGYENKLLKPILEDLKRFKRLTKGNPIIMGKNTWDSLPKKPLPDRINCVVARPHTTNDGFLDKGNTVEQAIKYFRESNYDCVYVIGGEKIYRDALHLATKLELTHIDGTYTSDRFFPSYESQFKLKNEEKFDGFKFSTYVPKKKPSRIWQWLTTEEVKNNNNITIIRPNALGMLIYKMKKLLK